MASIPWLVFYAVIYFFIIHIIDTYTIQYFISRFVTPLSYKETWNVRGVSYILMVLNYHAGQGAFSVYLKKTHKASISKTLGTMAFISAMDLVLVYSCSVFAAFKTNPSEPWMQDLLTSILTFAPVIFGGYLAWILFWKNIEKPAFQWLKKFRITTWILQHDVFLIFREAHFKDYLLLLAHRLPFVVLALGAFNLCLFAFNASIAWTDLYLYNPIITIATTIPITPSGFGTAQILTVAFFQNKVQSSLFSSGLTTPAALLTASSMIWALFNQILKGLFGLFCLSRTSKALFIEQDENKSD